MRRASLAALFCVLLPIAGCKVSKLGALEHATMAAIKHHVTVGNKSEKSPLTYTPKNIADGKEAFGHHCVACHGKDGQKTGMPFADRLSPQLPSLASVEVQSYTDGQLKWVIDNGLSPSGMPASRGGAQ